MIAWIRLIFLLNALVPVPGATASSTTRPVLELPSRAILREHVATVKALALGSDGITLASADESGAILVWNLKLARKIRALDSPKNIAVLTLAMSSDGQRLVSAHADGIVRVWDVNSGELLQKFHVDAISSARLAPAEDAIVCTRGTLPDNTDDLNHVQFFDIKTGKKRGGIDADFEFVSDATISSDGSMLALSGGESLTDIPAEKGGRQRCRIDLWDISHGLDHAKLLRSLGQNAPQPLLSPTFSKGGKLIAAAAGDWLVFETAGGKQVATIRATEFRARSCAISPNVRWIATGSIDSTVAIVDTHDWQVSFQNQSDPSLDVNAICFSPDGTMLIASRGRLIELFALP